MSFPAQTKFIVGNEACERFSFYGMRSILVLYMVSELAMNEKEAVEVSHLFNACIYILPLLGAWVADCFFGRYRMILYVSLFYCLGHGVLATSDLADSIESRRWILFTGLALIAFGAGGIKPCVSAFVGDQVDEADKRVMTRIYAAFYWSINLGSFFSFLVIPWVRQNWGYSWAFAIPGVFMALATFIFLCGRKTYHHRPPSQPHFFPLLCAWLLSGLPHAEQRFGHDAVARAKATLRTIGLFLLGLPCVAGTLVLAAWGGSSLARLLGASPATANLCALPAALFCLLALLVPWLRSGTARGKTSFVGCAGAVLFPSICPPEAAYSPARLEEARSLLRILTVFLLIIPFWSLFDQTMSSWVLQGEKMQALVFDNGSLRFSFGAEEMQSFNPLIIMVFVPLITLFVYPHIGRWAAPLRRMGCGIVLAGISYACVAGIQWLLDAGAQLSILWQCIPYFLLTISEILVSTTGLEYAYTAAGPHLKSIVSGFWFLTSTLGNFLVIYLTSLVTDPASCSTFLIYAALSLFFGLLFLFVTSRRFFPASTP